MKRPLVLALVALMSWAQLSPATVHDGRSYAIESALPQLDLAENPFVLRQSWWDGELGEGERNIIRHQLFKRNEYWFWAGCSDSSAEVSIHIYDSTGRLTEQESWQRGNVAAALVVPEQTGSYLIVVQIDKAEAPPAEWAVVYAYR